MKKLSKKFVSLILSLTLIFASFPIASMITGSNAVSIEPGTVTDPGTASAWETMMGTDADGNRYAGRVWADKSVYKEGDIVILNSDDNEASSFEVALEDDETFQIIFSALGSSMSSKDTKISSGPMDVVIVLDNSTSMQDKYAGTTRLEKLIVSANGLLSDLLSSSDIRIGITSYNYDADTVLPFGSYTNGVTLSVDDYEKDNGGKITASDNSGKILGEDDGYKSGTNTQSGYDLAMKMLEGAEKAEGRTPVAIVLTDGAANTAVDKNFYDISKGTIRQRFYDSGVPVGVALSTLLNAAYMKASVEDNYGTSPVVYGIGVDLEDGEGAEAIINPGAKDGFSSTNDNKNIREAYKLYKDEWCKGKPVSVKHSNYEFKFDHNYPEGSAITDQDVMDNINYVDYYYNVASAELKDTFKQIYEELTSGAFNPITSTQKGHGETVSKDTPLIFVDFIGQYMEVKDVQAVTLFGSSFNLTKGVTYDGTEDGKAIKITPFSVQESTGENPTTHESWNTAEDIQISVIEYEDGTQKLEAKINQEILPILLEQLSTQTVGNTTIATIDELVYGPLRIYYTVGIDSDILLPGGKIDVSKIQGYDHINDASGTVSFYSNRFGVMNPEKNGAVELGDAHIGFHPSEKNRYYYNQANQGIFTDVQAKDGSEIEWERSEYGVLWEEDKYELNWMTYDEYLKAEDGDEVYTYVTYYHPTATTEDADNAAEEVTYLIYSDWKYLKDSVSFYDARTEKYVNFDSESGKYTLDDEGYVVSAEKIAEYAENNPHADLYAVIGVGSQRTSRLHNMTVEKSENATDTAIYGYAPEYTSETGEKTHNGNTVVIWLGNNGMHTVEIDTGIALTKNVTEAFGNINDTYALTVTLPAGIEAEPVVVDAKGSAVYFTYDNNVITVNVKAGETVYVSGIPGGTECVIGEKINGDYHIVFATDKVIIPKVSEVLLGKPQFVEASVTNAPNKYGNLTVIKDVLHDDEISDSMAEKEFTFKVQLPASLANKTFEIDTTNASLVFGSSITADDSASFEISLKDNESVTIIGIPENAEYTVTEISVVPGYENTTGALSGIIIPDFDNTAHFINTYKTTPIKPNLTITGKKILVDNENTYTENEDFTFVLSEYVGVSNANPTGYNVLATDTAKAGESYSFNLEDVLTGAYDVGTYFFRVTELAGNTEGMAYDSQRGLFAVIITDDDADGTLEYRVENYANTVVNGNTVTKDFTNIYNVSRTFVDINIVKELKNSTGIEIYKDIFKFILVNVNDTFETYSATTDASGRATIRVSNLAEGTYKYKLSESDGDMAGMIYDSTEYIVVINVTNDNGTLVAVAEIEGATEENKDNSVEVTFVNEYKLDPVAHVISGKKELAGRAPLDGEFSFELYETDSSFIINSDAVETVKNKGSIFSFATINYDKVGTYYYSVKEKAGNAKGVTYDTTHYHVTVKVEIDVNNPEKLAVTNIFVNKVGHNSDTTGNIVFVNTYSAAPTSYTISGTKILTGRAIHADEFKFRLYRGDVLVEEVGAKTNGTFTFSPITYTEAGEYVYTVKEVKGMSPGVVYTGADNPVTVKVNVTDNDGALVAAADVANKDIIFVNEYSASAATVTFEGTKTLVGKDLNDGDFTFELYETDHSFEITDEPVATVKNDGGRFDFETIRFDKAGNYFYIIKESRADAINGIVYDSTQHKLHVQIKDTGYGKLSPTVINFTENEVFKLFDIHFNDMYVDVRFKNATVESAAQKNVYDKNDTAAQIDGEKVEEGTVLHYSITYTNYTGDAVVVDIRDTIPANTSYVEGSASHNGTFVGTQLHWTLDVAKNGQVTVTFDAIVNKTDAVVRNSAIIRDGHNVYTTNEVVNHTVNEPAKKDVFAADDLTASIDKMHVEAGDILRYEITYHNASDEEASVTITDKIPEHTTYEEGSASSGGVFEDGVLTWNIEKVAAWEKVTVYFEVKVEADNDGVTISNVANVSDGNNVFATNEVTNEVAEPSDDDTDTPENPSFPEKPDNKPEEKPEENPEQEKPENPVTGDRNVFFLAAMLLISCFGFAVTARYAKKKKEDNR